MINIMLLKPTFSLLRYSQNLSILLFFNVERSPIDLYNLLKLLSYKRSHYFGIKYLVSHFRRRITLPVSYYALFKGKLLLS